ncbi:AAA family ATPase [Blautia liquoris]|uniref:AAA family ATPase n=1 Tax=Blautia liquoris TaxID=2779518 RepID=A0A7M2RKJ4_9FIRM|nr:AAA family ATPase [Blautia liquoris]QOV19872.1 AAA family ATPase [Blautia liquoris]
MKNSSVRLSEISIQNFKNVENGQLNFINRRKDFRSSILGLYGQNGSGKTALIDAIQLLKYTLCGKTIPTEMADYINIDAEYANMMYVFEVLTPSGKFEAFYEFHIRREENLSEQNLDLSEGYEIPYKIVISDEILSYSFEGSGQRIRKGPLIDTRTDGVFVPVSKYHGLIGNDKNMAMNLLVAKKMAANSSRSFIFSRELLNAARKQQEEKKNDLEFMRHLTLLENLIFYGNYELFVINTANTGMISMNALPLSFKYEERTSGMIGQLTLPLDSSAVIPKDALNVAKKIICNMNIVLEQLVPGLTIGLKESGSETLKNGKEGTRIQLISRKNNKDIPLKYESEGIKKIISVLQLLIVIYNQSSITVAIDELDSGVFEYLLGEILRIISEKGKGQLIFTSHNLRPLETLDRGFIAFTTTNPSKRYMRMSNLKDNNNLRDFYFRDIVLGEQNEEVYKPTNNAEIALAFREAGDISAT